MNKNVMIALVVVVLGGGIWWMMSGDSTQGVIDDTIAMTKKCMEADADQDACKKEGEELEARWKAVTEGMTDEEKAEWNEKAAKAMADALDLPS